MRKLDSRWTFAMLLALGGAATTWTTPGAAQVLDRHPYIQRVSSSSAVVVWTTDVTSAGTVDYGSSPGALNLSASSPSAGTQHEVEIAGLEPDTRYYYAVRSGAVLAGGDADHYFDTAPVVGSTTKFRAWVVGDSGTGGSRQAQVRDAMLAYAGAYRPELFLHVGDMAYSDGTTDEFSYNFFAPYRDILKNTVTWPAMGNHEGHSSDSGTQTGPYYTAYVLPTQGQAGGLSSGTEAYYSFDWANVHFVVLDSHDSPREPGGAMLSWMQSDLAATDQDWIVAYWHHPPYTKGSHDSDGEGQLVDMRENALPILEAAGVDLVLAGHSHIYERSFLIDGAYDTPTTAAGHLVDDGDGRPLGTGPYAKAVGASHGGAVYVVAGHGGTGVSGDGDHPVMYFSEVDHGSCVVDVQGNRLSLSNVRWDGEVTDRFTMVKGDAIVVASPDGGERLLPCTPTEVQWATVGDVPEVQIEYSLDDGATWVVAADAVANVGSYTWTPPDEQSSAALVRVSSTTNAAISDESNTGFSIAAEPAPLAVIAYGDVWRYSDDDTDHGVQWVEPGFDDGTWSGGPGQLGYGDGDEATILLDQDPNVPTVYFRKRFELTAQPLSASVELVHDDGFAVWINGEQVLSEHVDGALDHASYASSSSDDNEVSGADIPATPFVVGENVVAVMVKQSSSSSSDLSFDLKLDVVLPADVPECPVDPGAGGGGAGVGGDASGGAAAGSGGAQASAVDDDDGCGCRFVGATSSRRVPWLAVGLGLWTVVHRRRRQAGRSSNTACRARASSAARSRASR